MDVFLQYTILSIIGYLIHLHVWRWGGQHNLFILCNTNFLPHLVRFPEWKIDFLLVRWVEQTYFVVTLCRQTPSFHFRSPLKTPLFCNFYLFYQWRSRPKPTQHVQCIIVLLLLLFHQFHNLWPTLLHQSHWQREDLLIFFPSADSCWVSYKEKSPDSWDF
jgi:hypothetical protein